MPTWMNPRNGATKLPQHHRIGEQPVEDIGPHFFGSWCHHQDLMPIAAVSWLLTLGFAQFLRDAWWKVLANGRHRCWHPNQAMFQLPWFQSFISDTPPKKKKPPCLRQFLFGQSHSKNSRYRSHPRIQNSRDPAGHPLNNTPGYHPNLCGLAWQIWRSLNSSVWYVPLSMPTSPLSPPLWKSKQTYSFQVVFFRPVLIGQVKILPVGMWRKANFIPLASCRWALDAQQQPEETPGALSPRKTHQHLSAGPPGPWKHPLSWNWPFSHLKIDGWNISLPFGMAYF